MVKTTVLLVVAIGALVSLDHAVAPPRDFATAVDLEETPDLALNATMGDVDGDGDVDLVLARGGHALTRSRVYLNDGRGGFSGSDLADTLSAAFAAQLADVDGDTDLDLFTGTDYPDRKLLYENVGDGGFVVAATWGDRLWATRNVSIADLNQDKQVDVIAANRRGPSYVCLNQDGRFDAS